MCAKCYRHWLDHTPPEERETAPRFAKDFWDFVEKTHEHGCWVWRGHDDVQGYGRWSTKLAHRHSWELANGPIPDGLWALHYCDNPPCVNPRHLYLGTIVENTIDAVTRGRNHIPPLKTHCKKGHALEGDNLRVVGRGQFRVCRTCDNERSRRKQAELRKTRPIKVKKADSRRPGHRVENQGPSMWGCSCGAYLAPTHDEARVAMAGHRRELNADREIKNA
jgi:hypothetical protein